jgi:hypothetical protein|tara:strand:- start:2062 stop:2379 length:318 start_codon:yes stop_codon:yes gene_type:complete
MTENKIFYWCVIIPLVLIIAYLHNKGNDNERDHERDIATEREFSNSRVNNMAHYYAELTAEQSKRHMAQIVKIEAHHKKEIEQCIEYYDLEIERAIRNVSAELSP